MEPDQYDRFAEVDAKHWWFVARRKVVASLLDATFGISGSKIDILDIGTGSGGMIPLLANYGNLVATEPDASALRMTKDKFSNDFPAIEFINSGWEQLELGARKFNLVTAFDVLEHCENDVGALNCWKSLLKDDGRLFITVPAFLCLWGTNDRVCHHFRRYTRASLSDSLKQSGLSIERISYMNALMFLPVWVSRNIKEKLELLVSGEKQLADCWDFAMPPPAVNAVLEKTFSWEANWLPSGNLPIGTSLICVARKS